MHELSRASSVVACITAGRSHKRRCCKLLEARARPQGVYSVTDNSAKMHQNTLFLHQKIRKRKRKDNIPMPSGESRNLK